jgi:hypothetical protein
MKLIAHRGNIRGRNPERENSPDYIKEALTAGYDAEIDVWYINNGFCLGHDESMHEVDIEFLKTPGLWCHAKSLEALEKMLENNVHCFWHQTDDFTITSHGYIWTYPGKPAGEKSVIVCHSADETQVTALQNIAGVCSDYVGNIK